MFEALHGGKLRILFVENHPHFSKAVIKQFLMDHEVIVVPSIAAAKEACEMSSFEVALVDYDLDDGKGDDFVRYVTDKGIGVRIIACSSHDRGNAALVKAGAVAVCPKMEFSNIKEVL